MLKAKDFRQQAWGKLKGKWGTFAVITLIYVLIMGACSALSRYYVGSVASLLLGGPLAMGFAIVALNVAREKSIDVGLYFSGFRCFGKAFVLYLTNGILIFLWSLLLVIPGIIKTLSYSMSYMILADNPEMSANEARKQSMQMMNGNKWRLFCLQFSFIGWMLLSILTLGILLLWVLPYMQAVIAEFYQSLLPQETDDISSVIPSGTGV